MSTLRLFVCGDVMTGRGIDQVLPHPGDPRIHEEFCRSALDYVALAERTSGAIPAPVDLAYVWGDALAELARVGPDARIVNLETTVTTSDDAWPGKGVHYRMHPANVGCLTAAAIDCCVLANNHVLDWGYAGLRETLATLRTAGLRTAGAGLDGAEAAAPVIIDVPARGRVAVFAVGSETSGIPPRWAAAAGTPGVHLLPDLSDATVRDLARLIRTVKQPRTVVVVSVHWGENWGYRVPDEQRRFAHRLVDEAGVDVVHGHSSHHVKALEVYRERLILYGCGDLLDDYEGIGGYEEFRGDLRLMYFPLLDATTGALVRLDMTPARVRRFRLARASPEEARWLADLLAREGAGFGTRVRLQADGTLALDRA